VWHQLALVVSEDRLEGVARRALRVQERRHTTRCSATQARQPCVYRILSPARIKKGKGAQWVSGQVCLSILVDGVASDSCA
jgi:hypothetical protein